MTEQNQGSFALKYRPRLLSELMGQPKAQLYLEGLINEIKINKDKPPRSIFISGPFGSGKTTVGRMIARYLNCLSPLENGDPCGQCDSCQMWETQTHPDLREVNVGSERGIDYIRGLIQTADYAPRSNFKVYLLDEFHAITPQGLTSFLKPLEDGTPRTIFILITTNPEKIKSTIISRCQKIQIKLLPDEDMLRLLGHVNQIEQINLPAENLNQIVEASHGHARDALQSLQEVATMLKSGKFDPNSADFSDMISKSLLDGNVWESAKTYLSWLYCGKFTQPFQVCYHTDEHESLLYAIVDFHIQAMFHMVTTAQDIKKRHCWHFFKLLDKSNIRLPQEIMTQLTDIFVNTYDKVKSYTMPPYFGLIDATCKAGTVVKNYYTQASQQ